MKLFRSVIICTVTAMLWAFTAYSYGQSPADTTKLWNKGGNINISFSQTTLTNWAAGGENSIASNTLVNLFTNYKKNKSSWDNTLVMAYGLLKQGDLGLRKSEDKIDLSSKYGYQASKFWYYSALLNFKSQFTTTYKYTGDTLKVKVSDFLSPGYLLFGIGMDYKPSDILTLYLSPLTSKTTIVMLQDMADAGMYGVEPAVKDTEGNIITEGKNIMTEHGAYLKMVFTKKILENTDLQTKLELFSSYTNHPENIDINWEVMLAMKINKFLTTTISTQLLYDDDIDIKDKDGNIGPRTQFREMFGIGLSFVF